jgi:hypothetical protein
MGSSGSYRSRHPFTGPLWENFSGVMTPLRLKTMPSFITKRYRKYAFFRGVSEYHQLVRFLDRERALDHRIGDAHERGLRMTAGVFDFGLGSFLHVFFGAV